MPIRIVARATPLVLAILLMVARAGAQPATSTPEHLAAARELLEAMQVDRAMLGTVEATIDAQIAQMPAMAEMRGVMLTWAAKYMNMEYMGDQLAAAYAEEFSASELNELTAFYRTPIGVKLADRTPALARRGAMVGAEIAAKYSGELQQMIQEQMTGAGNTAEPPDR